jgi:hypothetical protein
VAGRAERTWGEAWPRFQQGRILYKHRRNVDSSQAHVELELIVPAMEAATRAMEAAIARGYGVDAAELASPREGTETPE